MTSGRGSRGYRPVPQPEPVAGDGVPAGTGGLRDGKLPRRRGSLPVERGKIREFARACLSASPDYLLDPRPVIPPTFLSTVNFWTDSQTALLTEVGLDPLRVLHAAQEYWFMGEPPRAGTTLDFEVRVEQVYDKAGRRGGSMTFVEIVTDFRSSDVLVARSHSTALQTSRQPSGRPPYSTSASDDPPSRPPETEGLLAAEPRRFGPLTRTDIVRYQGAEGDMNPVHHDEEFARRAGFPTVISVGMFQAGILAAYAAERFGATNIRHFGVRFEDIVWPGDELVCSAGSSRVRHEVDGSWVDVELDVSLVPGGRSVVVGKATFAMSMPTTTATTAAAS